MPPLARWAASSLGWTEATWNKDSYKPKRDYSASDMIEMPDDIRALVKEKYLRTLDDEVSSLTSSFLIKKILGYSPMTWPGPKDKFPGLTDAYRAPASCWGCYGTLWAPQGFPPLLCAAGAANALEIAREQVPSRWHPRPRPPHPTGRAARSRMGSRAALLLLAQSSGAISDLASSTWQRRLVSVAAARAHAHARRIAERRRVALSRRLIQIDPATPQEIAISPLSPSCMLDETKHQQV